jgi:hypothetical protein
MVTICNSPLGPFTLKEHLSLFHFSTSVHLIPAFKAHPDAANRKANSMVKVMLKVYLKKKIVELM